jgi:hypothetical protein
MTSRAPAFVMTVVCAVLSCAVADAETTGYFDTCQSCTLVATAVTSDTISSNGYLFTYTRDKLFTGGTGQPIGRQVRVPWPTGVEAQAVTTPPAGVTDYKARITLQRVDGQVFDLTAFTFQLLANTAGAGGTLEIMPLVNGEDAFANPVLFDATGIAGNTFTYDTSPNPWGSTVLLAGFDTYKIALYVDFAFVGLTLSSASQGPQSCCLAGATCADLTPDSCVLQGGTPQGAATSCSCNPCPAPPPPPPVPDGRNGTTPMSADNRGFPGDSMQVSWDVTTCAATDYNLLYGDLNSVGGYTLSGALCSLGTGGSHVWSGVPAGNIFFVVVATNGAGAEGSWCVDSMNQECNGSAPSGLCGASAKITGGTCP